MAIRLPRKWINQSFWAILDQGFFAASNFALNIMLARWLGVEAYGAFGIAFTVFLFVAIIHTSLLTEPMMVFCSGRFKDGTLGYLRNLLKIHWTAAWLGSAAIALLSSFFYWGTPSREPILLLAFLTGPLLYPWLLRRACYPAGLPRIAAESGAIYLILLLGSTSILRISGSLTVLTALMAMGACAALSGAWIQFKLSKPEKLTSATTTSSREIRSEHWTYGKWALLTGIVGWIPGNLAMLILPVWGGVEASGEYRAAFNLVLPVQQVLAAAGPLLLPFLVRSRELPVFQSKVTKLALAFMIAPALWTALLAIAGSLLAGLLYDDAIPLPTHVLLLLGIQTILGAGVLVLATGLRAMEKPKEAFKGYLCSSLLSLLAGIPLMAVYGLTGAAAGGVISTAGSAVIMVLVFRKTMRPDGLAQPVNP
ncbi:hypothetical protein NT6N_18030 [Oceaniferula spumae]|uniref:Polysaccharide biosynthesis protein C-terminal domain-containing protein n=1 Tax=Oceaniferula spumae TaxID=2979115 RepID=A0AAT9FLD5_9BACT